jgi:hypothetical protein
MLKISSTFYSRPFEEYALVLQFIVKLAEKEDSSNILRVEYSNWISRLFCYGSGLPEFEKCEANFSKGPKAAAFQLRSPPAEEATIQIEKIFVFI